MISSNNTDQTPGTDPIQPNYYLSNSLSEEAQIDFNIPTTFESLMQPALQYQFSREGTIAQETQLNKVLENSEEISSKPKTPHKRARKATTKGASERKSKVWEFYKRIVTKEGLDFCVCKICGNQYSYTTSTTTLSRHLSSKHDLKVANISNISKASIEPRIQLPTLLSDEWVTSRFKIIPSSNDDCEVKCLNCDFEFSSAISKSVLLKHYETIHENMTIDDFNQRETFNSPIDGALIKSHGNSETLYLPYDAIDAPETNTIRGTNEGIWAHFIQRTSADGLPGLGCKYCSKDFSLKSSTSTLARHLLVDHKIKYGSFKIYSAVNENTIENEGTLHEHSDSSIQYNARAKCEGDLRQIALILRKWILYNPCPKSLVTNQDFKDLLFCMGVDFNLVLKVNKGSTLVELDNARNCENFTSFSSKTASKYFLTNYLTNSKSCPLCGASFSGSTSTTILLKHLVNVHPHLFTKVAKGSVVEVKDPILTRTFYLILTRFLISDLRPMGILNQELFQKFNYLIEMPNPVNNLKEVGIIVDQLYEDKQIWVDDLISTSLTRFSLVFDMINLRGNMSTTTVSFCFIDKEYAPQKIVISTEINKTNINLIGNSSIINVLATAFSKYPSVQNRIQCVLINSPTRSIEFATIVQKQLFSMDRLSVWVITCQSQLVDRAIFSLLLEHPMNIKLRVGAAVLKELSPTSTPYISPIIERLLTEYNWKDILMVLKEKDPTSKLFESNDTITEQDWISATHFLTIIAKVLEPLHFFHQNPYLKVGEAYFRVRELFNQINTALGPILPNTPKILNHLDQFCPNLNQYQVVLGIILDPRFKLQSLTNFQFGKHILDKLRELYISISISNPSLKLNDPLQAKLAMNNLSNQKAGIPDEPLSLELEFERYNSLPTINLNEDPILWWKAHQKDFSILYRVALEFLAIPANARFLIDDQTKLSSSSHSMEFVDQALALWSYQN